MGSERNCLMDFSGVSVSNLFECRVNIDPDSVRDQQGYPYSIQAAKNAFERNWMIIVNSAVGLAAK